MKEEQSKQDVRALFHFFSRNIREQLLALPLEADGMEEVRLRVSAPLYYIYKNKEYTAGSGFRVSREDVDDVRERYRLYLLTPPKKRHHRLNMEEVVEKSKG